MAQGLNAGTLALQFERVRDKVALMYQRDDTFYARLKKRGDVEIVSTRNMRIPLQLTAGGAFQQSNMDGGDLGVGTSTQFDFAQISPVFFTQATQFSKLAEYATNSNEKALENYAKIEITNAMAQMRTNIEAMLQGDGSGTLATVTSNPGGGPPYILYVDNANQFVDQGTYSVFPAVGGATRGTITVASVDALGKALYLTATPPSTGGATTTGDIIVVNGAAGTAGTSLLGIKYHDVDANTGTWLGLNRASYPGKLKCSHIDKGSLALVPADGRQLIQFTRRALGVDNTDVDDWFWYGNVEAEAAIENQGLTVTQVIQNQVQGDSSVDMLKHNAPKTWAGRPFVCSIHATPGRLEGIAIKHWGRGEILALDYLEWGGQTMFPTYGNSGGLNASTIFYFGVGFNSFVDNPRSSGFIDNFAVPTGY